MEDCLYETDFRKEEHDNYDPVSKKKAVELLKCLLPDREISINTDIYGIDIIAKREEKVWFFEVEYKNFSDLEIIKSEGLHIAYRKLKFYNQGAHHITFLDNYNKAILIHNRNILNSPIITKGCYRGVDYYPNAKFISVDFFNTILLINKEKTWKKEYKC